MSKNVLKMKDRKKVALRFKAIKVIGEIVSYQYSDATLLLMQKRGYSIEKEDIEKAIKETKEKMVKRHLDGLGPKGLTGAISKLKTMLNDIKIATIAHNMQTPEGLKNEERD